MNAFAPPHCAAAQTFAKNVLRATSGTLLVVASGCVGAQPTHPPEPATGAESYIQAVNALAPRDEQAIRQVVARLNHALDRADYELYASLFAADGAFISAFGVATGPQEIAAALEASRPFITNKRHVAANLVINGSEERAVVTSYLIVFERASDVAYVGSAVNVDTLEKQGGVWVVVRHDSELDPATTRAMEALMSGAQGR